MLIILKYVLYAKMKYQFLRQFQYVALTGLEFTVEIQLASNSRDFTCVCLPTCVCQGVYTTPTGKYQPLHSCPLTFDSTQKVMETVEGGSEDGAQSTGALLRGQRL